MSNDYTPNWVNKTWTVIMSVDPFIAAGNKLQFVGDGTEDNRTGNQVKNVTTQTVWGDNFFHDGDRKVTDVQHADTENIPLSFTIERIVGTSGRPNAVVCTLQDASTTSTCWTASDGGG